MEITALSVGELTIREEEAEMEKVKRISGEMEERWIKVQGIKQRMRQRKRKQLPLCFRLHLSLICVAATIMAPIHVDPTPVTFWHERYGTEQMACYLICVW